MFLLFICPNAKRVVLEFEVSSLFLPLLLSESFVNKERLHGKILGEVAQRINYA